jgi:hypothetical protein
MDIRYMATGDIRPEEEQETIGFVARSVRSPESVETFDQWFTKGWAGRTW